MLLSIDPSSAVAALDVAFSRAAIFAAIASLVVSRTYVSIPRRALPSLTMLDEERPLPRAYGKGTVVLQLPRERGIRPYLALSYIGSDDGMNQTVAADLGLAWGSW